MDRAWIEQQASKKKKYTNGEKDEASFLPKYSDIKSKWL